MVDFPNGPWKTVLSGVYDDYPLSVYLNQDGFILTEIQNPEKTKTALSVSLIFGVFGDAETFVETLPRNATFILLHGTSSDFKFLLLLSETEVLNYDQKEISDFINGRFKKVEKETKSIVDIASSYDINVKRYSGLPQEMKTMLFTNPVYMLGILPAKMTKSFASAGKLTSLEQKTNELFLGFFKTTNEKCLEPTSLFKSTLIFGDGTNQRVMRVLLEELSLNKINCVVFTYNSDILNMKQPSDDDKCLQEKTGTAPIGFPVVSYNIGEKIYVNLADLPEGAFCELNNISDSSIVDLINATIKEKSPQTLEELTEDIFNVQQSNQFTAYNISLAARIVQIVKQQYPKLYLGDFSVGDFFKEWGKNMGHINVILLNESDPISSGQIIYNVLKKINMLGQSNPPVAVFLPMAKTFFSRQNQDVLSKSLIDLVFNDLQNKYFLFAPVELDLDKKILDAVTARFTILDKEDIGMTLKDSKPYRLVLRPTLSKL